MTTMTRYALRLPNPEPGARGNCAACWVRGQRDVEDGGGYESSSEENNAAVRGRDEQLAVAFSFSSLMRIYSTPQHSA
jgi:hypothetical protein